MEYQFINDMKSIREILNLTLSEFANELGVDYKTIYRIENTQEKPPVYFLEKVYAYAFKKNIKINLIKEMIHKELLHNQHILLFHGAKSEIVGQLRIDAGRKNNDFGQGFYTGETYFQAISFVSNFDQSSVYYLDFNPIGLKQKKYEVDQEWMMTIAYYRGALKQYENHPYVQKLIRQSKECDYIVAPIADNRMFQIINSFVNGEITDEQCKHCLAATNLGNQYVFITNKALENINVIERCYVAKDEKETYKNIRLSDSKMGEDKVKLAKIQFRGKGKYIDEILG